MKILLRDYLVKNQTWLYYLYNTVQYNVHSKSVKKYANTIELQILNADRLKKHKKSDTLFVLGSGWTINDITKSQWKVIERNDSIGFNLWILHDFLPTYYMLEGPRDSNLRDLLIKNLNLKKGNYSETSILIKDTESTRTQKLLSKLQVKDFNEIYLCDERFIPGDDYTTLDLYFNKMKTHYQKNKYLLKKQATVFSILSLGYLLDYKQIVLCGIDLNGSEYFYNSEKYLNKYPGLISIIENKKKTYQSTSVHKTADPSIYKLPIDALVYWFNEHFKQLGSEILVENKSSILSRYLRKYKYE